HADPASDLPTVLPALDATLLATGPSGERSIAAGDFFQGLMATALAENEILTAIDIRACKPTEGMAYVKFTHPASRYAVVGAAAIVDVNGGTCAGARVSIGGLVPVAMRAPGVGWAMSGARGAAGAIAEAAGRVAE